jgi:[ribosomal protein S5]-alanine N-acetyltransferase
VISLLRIDTSRLCLRWLGVEDAAFIQRLLNDPGWLRFIGDRGIDNLDDARKYIEEGPSAMYRQYGFGLNRVALNRSDRPIGICGLLRREQLADADLGYAFLPEFRHRGYAYEAACAVLQHGFTELEQKRIAAIASADNEASLRLLDRLGFRYQRPFEAEAENASADLYLLERDTWNEQRR